MDNITPATLDQQLLKQVFVHNLNRIYFGKCYLNKNLAHIMQLASFTALQQAIQEFWDDVKKQIARMEEVYKLIDETPSDKNCNPIKSIIKDEFCLDEEQSIPILSDMDVIMYIQLLEHINITSCRMLMMVAKQLKYANAQQLLTECFDESIDNDQLFILISKEYLSENQ
jgi:ferritin-like metal-binding protein YciE